MNHVLASIPTVEKRYRNQGRVHSRSIGKYKPTKIGYIHTFFSEVNRWKSETAFESNPQKIVEHASFQKLVRMCRRNPDVIRLILEELQEQPSLLVWVLDAALDIKPYSDADIGDVKAMTDAWIDQIESTGIAVP